MAATHRSFPARRTHGSDRRARFLEGVEPDEPEEIPDGATPYGWAALTRQCERVEWAEEGTRNDTLFSAGCAIGRIVAARHLEEDLALAHLVAAGMEAGLYEDECERTVRSAFTATEDDPRIIDPTITSREDALDHLAWIKAVVHSIGWKGHKGKRMLLVLIALIRIATRAGGPVNFKAGTDGIALEAGTRNIKRITRGLQELIEAGWLTRLEVGRPGHATRWSIHTPQSVLRSRPTEHEVLLCSAERGENAKARPHLHQQLPVGHDAFRVKVYVGEAALPTDATQRLLVLIHDNAYTTGLGDTPWRVLDLLMREAQPLRRADIARKLGVNPATAGRAAKKLLAAGLLTEHSGRHLTPTFTLDDLSKLDEVAVRHNTAGAALHQRQALGWTVPDAPGDAPLTPRQALDVPLNETSAEVPPPRGSDASTGDQQPQDGDQAVA